MRISKLDIIIYFLIASIGGAGCNIFFGKFDPSRTLEAERIIESDSRYKEVDEICRIIKAPERSKFVGKAHLSHSIGILYFYKITISEDAAEKHFDEMMLNAGWTRAENKLLSRILPYRKNDLEVDVQSEETAQDVNLSVACKKVPN